MRPATAGRLPARRPRGVGHARPAETGTASDPATPASDVPEHPGTRTELPGTRTEHAGPSRRLRDDAGTMTILTTGILVVILMVIGVGVAITGVQLERNELQSMADGAALAASQGFSEADLYTGTSDQAPVVRRADAERIARDYLRAYPTSSTRTHDVALADLVVGEDGTVRVVLAARTDPPLLGWVTRHGDLSITLHAAGDARAR